MYFCRVLQIVFKKKKIVHYVDESSYCGPSAMETPKPTPRWCPIRRSDQLIYKNTQGREEFS